MRGDCRNGGIKVTGFVTPAARYCAITGGDYRVISGSNTTHEQGTCSFKSGTACKANAYFDGACSREEARVPRPRTGRRRNRERLQRRFAHRSYATPARR